MPHAKQDFGVTDVLDVVNNIFGLEGVPRGNEYDVLCPNPDHDERHPSCGVNLDSGYWHCMACGVGGDLAALGAMVLHRDREDVEALLRPHTAEALLTAVRNKVAALTKPTKAARRKPLPGPYEDGPLDSLLVRQFTPATLARWGVRFVPAQLLDGHKGEYTIRNSIAIPVRDSSGRLITWCYRTTDDSPQWQPRYTYYPGIDINELWFGIQHHGEARHIAIVEGSTDTMWLDQCGEPALGLLGSHMGERKIMWLQRYEYVVLFGDRDTAGARWVARVGDMLYNRMPVYVAQYRSWMISKLPDPDGVYRPASDPERLRPVDLELAMASTVPFLRWRIKHADIPAHNPRGKFVKRGA